MTGFRAARLRAGYPTAAAAHAAFSKGKKGREALSLSYWQKLEADGPRRMNPVLIERLARFLGCSANDIFAWSATPGTIPAKDQPFATATKGEATLTATGPDFGPTHHLSRGPGRSRTDIPTPKTRGPRVSPRASQKATTTMAILPRISGGSL